MEVTYTIIVLIFEILFYSTFMYYSRQDGSIFKYLALFVIVTILGLFIGTSGLLSYLILVLSILLGLKYALRVETTLYDMLVIVCMLLFKLLLEFVLTIPLYQIINSTYHTMIAVGTTKCVIVALISEWLCVMYKQMKLVWNNNNFYIRYIFSILVFLYTIVSCAFLVFN